MTKSLKKMISLILVLCLCFSLAAPVMAASSRDSGNSIGGCTGQTTETEKSEEANDPELILVEDETTVSEDTELRASTYAIAPAGANSRAVVGAAEASYSLASPTYAELVSEDGENIATEYYWSADGNTYYPVRVTRTSETQTSGGNNGCPGSTSSTTYYSFILYDDQGNKLATIERITNLNSTVSLSSGALYTQGPLLKYFPVTMLNYDQTTMNNATAAKEISETVTEITQVTTMPTWSSLRATTSTNGTYTAETAYLYEENGEYYPVTVQLVVSGSYLSRRYAYSLIANGNTIASASGGSSVANNRVSGVTLYVNADPDGAKWNGIYFGPSGFQTVSAAYQDPANGTNVTRNYAVWNYWTGYINDQNQKQQYGTNQYSDNSAYVYQGLVEDEFENGNIKFTVPDAGIFDINDTSTKDVYTNVGLPFVYEDGYYTFNAKEHSARFVGGAASNKNLTYSEETQVGGNNDNKDGFFPFNDKTGVVGTEEYHFGMVATIPFSMTSNGKISSAADAEDIVFSFAGDDDVWVFIDGKLVLDLGGIHDSADGDINFAANTTTVKRTEDSLGKYSGAFHKDGAVTENEVVGKLFNDADGKGVLNTDIETFAATDEHTLTIYYLERGQNESNCKIRFNLPMKDYVSVKKVIDGQAVKDGDTDTITYTTGLEGLSDAQINVLNNLDFGFTLYNDGVPVKNASYNLYDANNQYVNTASTDSNGHFTLKNGETARFITSFDEAESYFVMEDIKDGFIATNFATSINTPSDKRANVASGEYTYYKLANDGYHYVTDINGNKPISNAYTVVGSDESEDSIAFVCNNYMNASLPRPSAIPADDMIVVDYGLPVVVDLFSNDMYLGDTIEISFPEKYNYNAVNGVYTAEFGTFTYDAAKKSITYTLNEQLTDVEKIEYTLTGTAVGENNQNVDASGTANVYIIPATSMYYEENFSDMVTFTGNWKEDLVSEDQYKSANQEPGVVGTTNDSPYGSDAAYLGDSHDSNGTSKYVDTTDGAASFTYTFTGTGTTFFARTTGDSAYMRVQVYDKDNNLVFTYFRDTSFKDENGKLVDLTNNDGAVGEEDVVLYNIPVCTWDAEDAGLGHGTYKVVVSLAKKTVGRTGALVYGDQFWLDGIKVINPLDPEQMKIAAPNSNYAIANSAYSRRRSKHDCNYTS